jgi:DNA repair protein RadC
MEAVQAAVAEISVAYINKQSATERPVIKISNDAHQCLLRGFNSNTISLVEEFVAFYLNRANQVLGLYKVGVGGITGVVADPCMVIGVALKIAAVSIIVAHNHPSGSMKPSEQDKALTQKLREGAKFMDIKLHDHLIVPPCGKEYYSFADEGSM